MRLCTAFALLICAGCNSASQSEPAATEPSASAAPEPTVSPPPPPLPALEGELAKLPADPPPADTTRGAHFVVSNEDLPQLWQPVLAGLGGVHIGVGAEQNLLMAGWSRPEVLVLLDFDDWVVELNFVHGLLMRDAETPQAFIDAWRPGNSPAVARRIREEWPEVHERRADIQRRSANAVYRRLLKLSRTLADVPSVLSDPAQYAHVRELWKKGHATAVRGDLTAAKTLSSVGRLASARKLIVRSLYLSNTEWYFDYKTGSYAANIRALPFDEKSVVLSTRPIDDASFHYVWQPASRYLAWITCGKVKDFGELFEKSDHYADRYAKKRQIFTIPTSP